MATSTMETSDLLKKVRKIEIKTRGLSNQLFTGHYHSAFKGKGMAFSEVREYQYGDDIRSIDWNVTARLNNPYVKVFEEERELTVMLLIDISGSNQFGTVKQLKHDLIIELAAVLSFSAIENNDKVGVLFFTDKVEKFIPPKKGRTHILRIIRELINITPENSGTSINTALQYLNNVLKKRSIVFILSDFYSDDFKDPLRIINRKHDVAALQILDKQEAQLPDVGIVKIYDNESKQMQWIDTTSKQTQAAYIEKYKQHLNKTHDLFKKSGIDFTSIYTHDDYVKPLQNLFRKREARR